MKSILTRQMAAQHRLARQGNDESGNYLYSTVVSSKKLDHHSQLFTGVLNSHVAHIHVAQPYQRLIMFNGTSCYSHVECMWSVSI